MNDYERIHKITKGIKKIEEKMIELDALAKKALTSNLKINISIKDPNKKPTVTTEDGDLHIEPIPLSAIFDGATFTYGMNSSKKKYDTIYEHDVTDTVLIKIISVMMKSYKEQRKLYIKELKSIKL